MQSEEVRQLLGGLPPAPFTGTSLARYKAVFCDAIEDAGADPDEVEKWVGEHGGWERTAYPHLLEGGWPPEPTPPVSYLVIPLNALK